MSFRKPILYLLIILLILITGYSKNVFLDKQNDKLTNYNFNIRDLKNIDKTLSNQKYSYSTNIDKKYVAVINYQSKNASINQYLVDKDGKVDLTVPKGSLFVISLPANSTIAYTWNIKNNIENDIFQLQDSSWIDINLSKLEKGKDGTGTNYDRQNFHFKTLKSGNEKLVFRYEHQIEERNESFEVTFNIEVQ